MKVVLRVQINDGCYDQRLPDQKLSLQPNEVIYQRRK